MIDVVIINWNSGELLCKSVGSIIQNDAKNLVSNIIVVDNASCDESMLHLPDVKKIRRVKNLQNLGFACACNQGFKLTSSPYVLLLNPDAMVFENTLSACVNFMESNPDIDILGCQLLNDHGRVSPSCARFPKPYRYFFHAIGLTRILPAIFHPPTLMTDWDHQSSDSVEQVMGAFMFMRRSVFDRIGFFDERFFVYYEELDFSLRLKKSGGKTYFNSKIQAMHSGGGTTNSVVGFRLFLSLQSRLRYARKHFSTLGFWVVFLSTWLIEPWVRLMLLLFTGRIKEISSLLEGYTRLLKAS
jgi:GT2 family glycosyltransferase